MGSVRQEVQAAEMTNRTREIFMTCCLEGDAGVISRILKKNRKSWTGKIANNNFNINSVDTSDRSGLMLACIQNHKEVVDLLLSRSDLDVNLVDIFGATSLMYASKNKEGGEVVELLLEIKDLDLDEKDQDGKTAEDFAASEGNHQIVQMIREERLKRMGRSWNRPEAPIPHIDSESDESHESETDVKSGDEADESIRKRELASTTDQTVQDESNLLDEDLMVKSELKEKLEERIEEEKKIIADKEWQYMEEMLQIDGDFRDEKAAIQKMMEEKIKEREHQFMVQKAKLEEAFAIEKEKSEKLISKLETAKGNISMSRLLEPSLPCSELECPVCLEEMRPPVRIWQCVSGHAVCEECRKSPLVKDCPSCRQKIVGRNIPAEKLARSLFPVSTNESKSNT